MALWAHWSCDYMYWSGLCVSLPPPHSVQLLRHVSVGVGDGGGSVPAGPPHPSHPRQQPPVRLHRQAAVQAALLWVTHTPLLVKPHNYSLSGNNTQWRMFDGFDQDSNIGHLFLLLLLGLEKLERIHCWWYACFTFKLKGNAACY